MASTANYNSGQVAYRFHADGAGFVYYPSGRVAACVSRGVETYQMRHYFYDDDTRNTLLCALDEFAVGFALALTKERLVLSKDGGLLANSDGDITMDWKWDQGAIGAGRAPSVPLRIALNRYLTFTFTNRFEMEGTLQVDGQPKRTFACGLRTKTTERTTKAHTTLMERQTLSGVADKAKRDRLNPRSGALTQVPGVHELVANLEVADDKLKRDYQADTPFGSSWKQAALDMTLGELPPIKPTETQTGVTPGFGTSIYAGPTLAQTQRAALASTSGGGGPPVARAVEAAAEFPTAVSLLPTTVRRTDGKWQGELDMRHALRQKNPLLKRSVALCAASGRYSEDITIPGGLASADNPTGKFESGRSALRTVPAAELDAFLKEEAGPEQLVVVACLRDDDVACRVASKVVEAVAGMNDRGELVDYENGGDNPMGGGGPSPFVVVRCNMSESRRMVEKYNVRSLPTMLMYHRSKLAYMGNVGGCRVRVRPDMQPWRVLLVEPNFKAQIHAEKMLKKHKFHWDLCMTGAQAVSMKQKLGASGSLAADVAAAMGAGADEGGEADNAYDCVLVSDDVPPADVALIERAFRASRDGPVTVVCGMATVKGEAGAGKVAACSWVNPDPTSGSAGQVRGHVTYDTAKLLPERLAAVADLAVTRPLKMTALEDLTEYMKLQAGVIPEVKFRGLTAESLAKKMYSVLAGARKGLYSQK